MSKKIMIPKQLAEEIEYWRQKGVSDETIFSNTIEYQDELLFFFHNCNEYLDKLDFADALKNGYEEEKTSEDSQKAISWEQYFMGIASLSAARSKDPRTKVGACIVNQENKIVGTGYNGMPLGDDENFPWDDDKYSYVVHAELNAILNSIKKLDGCTIYTTLFPCSDCCKAIAQSGIKEVIYRSDKYSGTEDNAAAKYILDTCDINYRSDD